MATALGSFALRLGFVLRELRFAQQSIWEVKSACDEYDLGMRNVDNVLGELTEVLIGLSGLASDFQKDSFEEVRERLVARHWAAYEHVSSLYEHAVDNAEALKDVPARFREALRTNKATKAWRQWQAEDWRILRNLVTAVIRKDKRLMTWFEIGDRSAKALFPIRDLESPTPNLDLCSIYSPMNDLPHQERQMVEGFIPEAHRDTLHLVCQVRTTFRALCKLLDSHEEELVAVPSWDGSVLEFHGKRKQVRNQHNNVITPILDLFQQCGWQERVSVPAHLKGDVPQAIYNFNQGAPIRLSGNHRFVSWSA